MENKVIVRMRNCGVKRRKQSKSGAFIDDADIPGDLLIEILIHLPFKCIFIFKCVSKRWLTLISDPYFSRYYVSRFNKPSPWTLLFGYMHNREGKIPDTEMGVHVLSKRYRIFNSSNFQLGFLPISPTIKVLATSNGLLLCCKQETWHKHYYVCNPLTAQWAALPEPPRIQKWVAVGFISQYDDSYKVVRIARSGHSPIELNLETFSSDTGEWKDFKVMFSHLFFPLSYPAVSFNGILHWVASKNKFLAYDPYNNDNDNLRLIDYPGGERPFQKLGALGVVNGRLRYAQFMTRHPIVVDHNEAQYLCVWDLINYDTGEWNLVHKANITDVLSSNRKIAQFLCGRSVHFEPLTFDPVDTDIVYWGLHAMVASYSLSTRTFKLLQSSLRPFVCTGTVIPFVLPPWPTVVTQPTPN